MIERSLDAAAINVLRPKRKAKPGAQAQAQSDDEV
jgi:hypothetical protein